MTRADDTGCASIIRVQSPFSQLTGEQLIRSQGMRATCGPTSPAVDDGCHMSEEWESMTRHQTIANHVSRQKRRLNENQDNERPESDERKESEGHGKQMVDM